MMKLICSFLVAVMPFQILAAEFKPSQLRFNKDQIGFMVNSMKTVGDAMAVYKAFLTPREYQEMVDVLKKYGANEATPIPKISVSGTSIRIEKLKGEFDVKNFGEVRSGGNVWRPGANVSPAQKLQSLTEFFMKGSAVASSASFLIPQANADAAGLGLVAAGAASMFSAYILALGSLAVMIGPLELTATAVSGLAMALALLAVYVGASAIKAGLRRLQDVSVECVDGKLVIGLDGRQFSRQQEALDTYMGSLERAARQEYCKPNILPKVQELVKAVMDKFRQTSAAKGSAPEAVK